MLNTNLVKRYQFVVSPTRLGNRLCMCVSVCLCNRKRFSDTTLGGYRTENWHAATTPQRPLGRTSNARPVRRLLVPFGKDPPR